MIARIIAFLGEALAEVVAGGNPNGAQPRFDTALAVKLFDAGASIPDIATHLSTADHVVKTSRVRAYLEKIGKITKPIPIADALAKIGTEPAAGGEQVVLDAA